MLIHVVHLLGLSLPVLATVLDDTKRVDPDKGGAKPTARFYSVSEVPGQAKEVNTCRHISIVGLKGTQWGSGLDITPHMA